MLILNIEKVKNFFYSNYTLAVSFSIVYCYNIYFTNGEFHLISLLSFLFNYIIFISFFIDGKSKCYLKPLSLMVSFFFFLLSMSSLFFFDFNKGFQFFTYYYYQNGFILPTSAVDGVSILLIVLTTFTISLVILCSWNTLTELKSKIFLINIFLVELFLILAFISTDTLLFFLSFECILIPMSLMIFILGSPNKKTKASYYFFSYTYFGSIFMFLSILYLNSIFYTSNYFILLDNYYLLTQVEELIIWLGFFLSFAFKLPIWPLHIWLPEAHVEASTEGSMILAGLLLKLGSFGFLRYMLCLLPYATDYYSSSAFMLLTISIFYSSFAITSIYDLKRVIAYSSVIHMNFALIGLFSKNNLGLISFVILNLNHAFISMALFYLIGLLYKNYGIKTMNYVYGLNNFMPIFSFFFFCFAISNFSFPSTINFIVELPIIISFFEKAGFFIFFIIFFSMFYTTSYNMWLVNSTIFGTYIFYTNNVKVSDISFKEIILLMNLLFINFFFFFYSTNITDCITSSIYFYFYNALVNVVTII